MADLTLSAQPRTIMGKQVKKLRREGLLPAVVYGPALQGPQPIVLPVREFERIYTRAGSAMLLDLQVEGARPRPVLIHQVQRDATRRSFLHVDFLAPDMTVELTVAVPLAFIGEAPAVTDAGGILTELVTELEVRCLPDRIPAVLEVDLSQLTELGGQLMAGDITLPTGVTLMAPPEELLVKVEQPAVTEEPTTDAAAAVEEGTEPAAAE